MFEKKKKKKFKQSPFHRLTMMNNKRFLKLVVITIVA